MHNNRTNACLYILVLGKFYLVDAGYACRPGFLPPYRGTRYHLNEYGGRHYPTNARELFNLRHSSLRVTVERAFGALKNRFRIIDNKPFHPFKTQVKSVLACCIIHNWILVLGEMRLYLLSLLGSPTDFMIMGMVFLWMTMQLGLRRGMNGLIACGLIRVTHAPRFLY